MLAVKGLSHSLPGTLFILAKINKDSTEYGKCSNFFVFWNCALIFSGDSDLLLKRTNPGSFVSCGGLWGYPRPIRDPIGLPEKNLSKSENCCPNWIPGPHSRTVRELCNVIEIAPRNTTCCHYVLCNVIETLRCYYKMQFDLDILNISLDLKNLKDLYFK